MKKKAAAQSKSESEIEKLVKKLNAERVQILGLEGKYGNVLRENETLRRQLKEARDDIREMLSGEYTSATRMEARSMTGTIVNCSAETRTILTLEKKTAAGTTAAVCNIDGEPIQDSGVTYAGHNPDHVEVYLDTISGEHVAKVSISQANKLRNEGEKVYQGVGGVQGWFVEAPDFTVSGRHGSHPSPKSKAATSSQSN